MSTRWKTLRAELPPIKVLLRSKNFLHWGTGGLYGARGHRVWCEKILRRTQPTELSSLKQTVADKACYVPRTVLSTLHNLRLLGCQQPLQVNATSLSLHIRKQADSSRSELVDLSAGCQLQKPQALCPTPSTASVHSPTGHGVSDTATPGLRLWGCFLDLRGSQDPNFHGVPTLCQPLQKW